jgi:3-hydroxyacyl-CoA dehydrogenase
MPVGILGSGWMGGKLGTLFARSGANVRVRVRPQAAPVGNYPGRALGAALTRDIRHF